MKQFKPVDSRQDLPKTEEEILKYWEENKIFEKSLEIRKDSPQYSFYDGPPFATGTPHYGHIVASVMKDVVPRYWTMQGYYVERKWGWDCHGLPIENIVEKELGSQAKKDIEKLGVEKFNELCRSKVLGYVDEWEKVIRRMGRWADMENSYKTMDIEFMESVWWVFKEFWDKGLLYEDYRSMHICPRCETTLSQSEVTEGYMDVKDLSATAKFEVSTNYESDTNIQMNSKEKTYILAWTTTPWTLIGNVALAVNTSIKYQVVSIKGEEGRYIIAKERLKEVVREKEYKVLETITGENLVGKSYKPLFDYYAKDEALKNRENGWKIYAGDFVTTEEGTGVVHIAPAFGEDDMNLGKVESLPFVQHVGMDGHFAEETGNFAGMHVKPKDDHMKTDIEIIRYLAHNNLLFHKEKYEHSYPHCWRCDTPLLNYATSSWFVNVTKIKEELLQIAEDINWTPSHMKEGRFGKWLEGARDWSISRQRFWASVMPVWKCSECDELEVFGNVKDLEEKCGEKIEDLHKHTMDTITYDCEECGGTMRRIPDVLDTWFDSGSMPYAQMHYPFENKKKLEENYPAQFIAEGVDQTRAWFYYLHVIGTALKQKNAYQNVIVNGIVLAEDGKKMSKKLQNYPDPMEVLQKYGADVLRFYLLSSPVMMAENMNFSEKEMKELVRGMFRMLWNSYSFFVLYANIDKFEPQAEKFELKTTNLLDRWIISELQVLTHNVNEAMTDYTLPRAVRYFPAFIDNLSNWYIRRSRKRFWKPARNAVLSAAGGSEDDNDKRQAYETLHHVLVELSKLLAPFTPFLAEEMYRNLNGGESVHLEDYPVTHDERVDEKLNTQMQEVRDIISEGLQLRAKAGIKVRQPLASLKLKVKSKKFKEEFIDIMKDEVNVKEILFDESQEDEVILDTEITEDLKLEGDAREVIRFIQAMRKEADYKVDDRISVSYQGGEEIFKKFGTLIATEVLAKNDQFTTLTEYDLEKILSQDTLEIQIKIKK